jgi:hypothetical protein
VWFGRLAQLVARFLHTEEVVGSSPASPTEKAPGSPGAFFVKRPRARPLVVHRGPSALVSRLRKPPYGVGWSPDLRSARERSADGYSWGTTTKGASVPGQRLKAVIKAVVLIASAFTFMTAVILLGIGALQSSPALITFAMAAIPASLAAAAAIFGVETWADARTAAVDEKARDALERFIATSTLMVSDGFDLGGVDLPMRSNMATWGSPALLRKRGERTLYLDGIAKAAGPAVALAREKAGDPKAPVTVDLGDRLAHLARLTAEAVAVARNDIGLAPISAHEMYDVLYGTVNGRTFDQIPPPHLIDG